MCKHEKHAGLKLISLRLTSQNFPCKHAFIEFSAENAVQVSRGCPQREHVTSHEVLPEATGRTSSRIV